MVKGIMRFLTVALLTVSCFMAVEAGLYPLCILCIAILAVIAFVTGRE